jgi:hypothetical protein
MNGAFLGHARPRRWLAARPRCCPETL